MNYEQALNRAALALFQNGNTTQQTLDELEESVLVGFIVNMYGEDKPLCFENRRYHVVANGLRNWYNIIKNNTQEWI